jgi:hypothetical protein
MMDYSLKIGEIPILCFIFINIFMKFDLLASLLLEEAPQSHNLLPIDDYLDHATENGELVIGDSRYDYIVVSPKTVESSCYYVKGKTKISFCIADPRDTDTWELMKNNGIRPYYFLSKNISIKNRNARAIFAIITGTRIPSNLDPKTFANMFGNYTKSQMVAAKLRKNPSLSPDEAQEQVDTEFHYTNPDGSYKDSFIKWSEDTLSTSKDGKILQIFDSQNKLVSPLEFKRALEAPFKLGGSSRNNGLYEKFLSIVS